VVVIFLVFWCVRKEARLGSKIGKIALYGTDLRVQARYDVEAIQGVGEFSLVGDRDQP
jgi:hypothetical protein